MKVFKYSTKLIYKSGLSFLLLSCATYARMASAEPIDLKSGFGRDHALLEDSQSTETQKFIQTSFYEDGRLNLPKVSQFLARLHTERDNLKKDLIQSVITEGVEVYQKKPRNAEAHASKMSHDSVKILNIYDQYLIPTLAKLESLMRAGEHADYWDGLIDDFIRGYHPFYAPNYKTTPWRINNDMGKIIGDAVVPIKIKKNNPAKDEAINLMVEAENIEAIRKCLGNEIQLQHYLTKKELTSLKACDFDLSLLNPGLSSFWEKRTRAEIEEFKLRGGRPEIFPGDNDFIVFDRLLLTGFGSPKFKVKALVNGVWKKYKFKWGVETHVDASASYMGHLLGFNQDKDRYRPETKVHLGKVSFESFQSYIMSRFGQGVVVNAITAHGGDKGNEWIIIKDCFLAAREESEEVRSLSFNPTTMDMNHRREFNGRLMFNTLLNIVDNHVGNMKFLLGTSERTGDSPIGEDLRPRVFTRFHDLGFGMATAHFLKNPFYLLKWGQRNLPNEFEADGMVTANSDKSEVKVRWSDFNRPKGLFSEITYSDAKWMVRQISKLTGDDIEWCFIYGGMPKELAKLMRHKVVSRRNEMVRAFDLANEIALLEVPNLSQWNSTPEDPADDPAVQKGKVVRVHFRGKQANVINQNTIPFYLVQGLNALLNLGVIPTGYSAQYAQQLQLGDQLTNQNNKLNGIGGLTAALGMNRNVVGGLPVAGAAAGTPGALSPVTFSLGVGINATVTRSVQQANYQLASDEDDKLRPWVVKDVIQFSIGVNSPLLQTVTQNIPVLKNITAGTASLRLIEIGIEYNQYSETYGAGFLKPITPILEAIGRPIKVAATRLGRGEMLRRYVNLGFDASVTAQFLSANSILINQVSGALGLTRMQDISYFRDPYGELHIFNQLTKEAHAAASLMLGQLQNSYTGTYNPFSSMLAVAGYSFGSLKYSTHQRDLVVERGDGQYSVDAPLLALDGQDVENLINQAKNHGNDELPGGMRLNFAVDGTGTVTTRQKSLLYAFNSGKSKTDSRTLIEHGDGNKRDFQLHSTLREKYTGVNFTTPFYSQSDLLVHKGRKAAVEIQMDRYNADGFTVGMDILDFRRTATRADIDTLIASLNRRYSVSAQESFYRDYSLPSVEEVNLYRRVYATTRVQIAGEQLLQKIEVLSVEDFEKMATLFFSEQKDLKYGTHEADLNLIRKAYRKAGNYRLTSNLVGYFKQLKVETRKLHRDYDKIFPLLDKFIYHQKLHKYGVSLLKQVAGTDNLYVTGDIWGIFQSFSTANDFQEKQRRRFAAKHWGNLELTQPIQRFLRRNNLVYPSLLVPIHVPTATMLGIITSGVPAEQTNNW